MKKSLPNILRFMSCAAVLYAGFLIAGWVIIGPYSLKVSNISKTDVTYAMKRFCYYDKLFFTLIYIFFVLFTLVF